MSIFLCYPKCSTCQKAQKFLDTHHIVYQYRDLKQNPPTVHELRQWITLSGKDPSAFFNKKGLEYRKLNLKNQLSILSEEEQIELLSTNGMLIKRPLFVTDYKVYLGFKDDTFEDLL